LIADRQHDHAESLRMLFEAEGCVVHSTGDAHAALQLIQMHRPDVLIIELDMLGAGGVCLAARNANPLGVYVAGIIGLSPDTCRCDATLIKPYRFHDLVPALERFISQRVRAKKAANGKD
jgi:CheY-like chemotaxis protein